MVRKKEKSRDKTTVAFPLDSLADTQAGSAEGSVKTPRLLSEKESLSKLLTLKGTFHFSIDINNLRED